MSRKNERLIITEKLEIKYLKVKYLKIAWRRDTFTIKSFK